MALFHVLERTQSIGDNDWVMHWPSRLRPVRGWDTVLRAETLQPQIDPFSFLVFASVPARGPTSSSEAESFFESWFGDKAQTRAAFYALDPNLNYKLCPLIRSGTTRSLGISFSWPIFSQAQAMKDFCARCVRNQVRDEELALTYVAGPNVWNSGKIICTGQAVRKVPNRKHQIAVLWKVLEAEADVADSETDAAGLFLESMALEKTPDHDLVVFSRALLGITAGSALQEILIKYGSEAAFETEKEALKYG